MGFPRATRGNEIEVTNSECELWIEDAEERKGQRDQKKVQKKSAYAVTVRVHFADESLAPRNVLSTAVTARCTNGDIDLSVGIAAPLVTKEEDGGGAQPQGLVEALAVGSPATAPPLPSSSALQRVENLPVLRLYDLLAGQRRSEHARARSARAEQTEDFQCRE